MPFAAASRDGVLTLTLDTPRSPINVFNHATAHQLVELLAAVTPANTRAIVFASAKPTSFINGVGLMLAQAAQGYDDIERASAPPWTAYRAVYEAPVPTIAVVRGNCFGCGVEFALNCDYRIAVDAPETQFYMTELNDYLFIPCFGSTWNLPAAVGLARGIDLLLWGERWSAASAQAAGLADAVSAPADDDALQRFVEAVLAERPPRRTRRAGRWSSEDDRAVAQARNRIAALPPAYQPLYREALDLLTDGTHRSGTYDAHRQLELRRSASSAVAPLGKSAYAFFYLRQIASERAAGRIIDEPTPVTLCNAVDGNATARAWTDDLTTRAPRAAGDADEIRLVGASAARGRDVGVCVGLATQSPIATTIYSPLPSVSRLLELATRVDYDGLDSETTTRLARTLQRLGFEVARTTPTTLFVSDRLLTAYLVPLLRFIDRGGAAATVNGALRRAGFIRLPNAVTAAIPSGRGPQLVDLLTAALDQPAATVAALLTVLATNDCSDDDTSDVLLLDALALSLLDAVLTIRMQREVAHLSIADVFARELLDFPRHLCSLCTWLKRARLTRALADPRVATLVAPTTVEAARAFADGGRELYR